MKDKRFVVPIVMGLVCILTYIGFNIISEQKLKRLLLKSTKGFVYSQRQIPG